MAKTVLMRDPATGITKKGFYGFSWTTLFFGGFPALFRGDLVIGILVIVANLLTCGLAGIIWAFIYNKKYTLGLVEKGYQFSDNQENIQQAMQKLGITH